MPDFIDSAYNLEGNGVTNFNDMIYENNDNVGYNINLTTLNVLLRYDSITQGMDAWAIQLRSKTDLFKVVRISPWVSS